MAEKIVNDSSQIKKIVLGDDPIVSKEFDWFGFEKPAQILTRQLYKISKNSGVCCGLIGTWGSGKSSFMKLMCKTLSQEFEGKIIISWFTAWDPSGISNLGDSLLFQLFQEVANKNEELTESFNKLKQALGIRRGIRQKASQALQLITKVVPNECKPALEFADGFIQEINSPQKVSDSFNELMKFLEKNNQTIFLFIDDINRASGQQIRDILSELKVYVNHPRIVAILGYDEKYVIEALSDHVLPEKTNPRKYIEKIVTIRKKLPLPTFIQNQQFSNELLKNLLKLDSLEYTQLSSVLARLSLGNPRRLKNYALTFSDLITCLDTEFSIFELVSILILVVAYDMGLFNYDNIVNAFDEGQEEGMILELEKLSQENIAKKNEIKAIIKEIETLKPRFMESVLTTSKLIPQTDVWFRQIRESEIEEKKEYDFEWSELFVPIFKKATVSGIELDSKIVKDTGITITNGSEVNELNYLRLECFSFLKRNRRIRSQLGNAKIIEINNDNYRIVVILTSQLGKDRQRIDNQRPLYRRTIIDFLHTLNSNSSRLVTEKAFILWLIDDKKIFDKYISTYIEDAKERSKGLKNDFIILFTPANKISDLSSELLNT